MTSIWYPGSAVHITFGKSESPIFQKYTRRKVRTYVIEIQWWKGVKRGLILLGKLRGIAKQRHDQRLEKNTSNEASEMSETFPGTTQSLNSSTCTNEWLFSCTIFHFLSPFSTHDIIIRQLNYSHHVGRKRAKRRARRPKRGRNQQLRYNEYALCALVLIDPSFKVDIISYFKVGNIQKQHLKSSSNVKE